MGGDLSRFPCVGFSILIEFEDEREVGFSVLGGWVSIFMGLGMGIFVIASVLDGNFFGVI